MNQEIEWKSKEHALKFSYKGKTYELYPREFSGTLFEYYLNNYPIEIDWGNNFLIKPNTDDKGNIIGELPYNYDMHTGEVTPIENKSTPTTVVQKSVDERGLPVIELKEKGRLTRTQIVDTEDGKQRYLFKTEATYLERVLEVVNYFYKSNRDEIVKFSDLDAKLDEYKLNPMIIEHDTKLPIFALHGNNKGDIHEIVNRKIDLGKKQHIAYVKIRKNTIFKTFEIDGIKYLLVGYPDYFKMMGHMMSDAKTETIKRFESTELDNANCKLLCRLSNLLGQPEMSEEEINSQKALWKITNMKTTEILDMKNVFLNIYNDNIDNYKTDTTDYIQSNQVLNQGIVRIRYIFHILELDDDKFKILVTSLQELTKEHMKILELVNQYIKEILYNHHIHGNKQSNLRLVYNFVSFTGFFHITSEYLNPLSNLYMSHYQTTNKISMEELIYSLNFPGFWSKVNLPFITSDKKLKLTDYIHTRYIPNQQGGHINEAVKFFSNKKNKFYYEIVLFNIDHNKCIICVIKSGDKYAFVELAGNKLDETKYFPEMISELKPEYQQLYLDDYFGSELKQIYLPNTRAYRITQFEYIDNDIIKSKVLKLFFTDKIPIVHMSFNNELLVKLRDYSNDTAQIFPPYIPRFVKFLVLYYNIEKNTFNLSSNEKDDIIGLLHKYHSEELLYREDTIHKFIIGEIKVINLNEYVGIYYENNIDSQNTFQYLLWILDQETYDSLVDNLVLKISNDITNTTWKIIQDYMSQLIAINKGSKYIKNIYDVNGANYETIFKIVEIVERDVIGVKKSELDTHIHSFGAIPHECIHFRIDKKSIHGYLNDKIKYLNRFSRIIPFKRIKSFINVDNNYYYNGNVNLYTYIGWRFIFSNKYSKMSQLGGKLLLTFENIKTLPEYNKPIYKLMTNSPYTYKDYNDVSNYTNMNMLTHNINQYLDDKAKNRKYQILYDFNKLTNLHHPHFGAYIQAININKEYNKGNVVVLTSVINTVTLLNEINNKNRFDVILDKGILSSKKTDEYKKRLKTNSSVINIYGDYQISDIDTYPKLAIQLENNYDNVIVLPEGGRFYPKYPTIFYILDAPKIFMKLLLALFILKDNGNMFFYSKVFYNYPLHQQFFDILFYLFDNVEHSLMNNGYSIEFNCYKFNRDRFEKHKFELKSILNQIGKYHLEHSEFNHSEFDKIMNNKLFYNSGNPTGNNYKIINKLNIDIPSSAKSIKMADSIAKYYYNYLDDMYSTMKSNIPLTDNNIMNLIDVLINKYIINAIKLFEENGIPYDKYYLTLLDNSYENIYQKMFNLDNNIRIQIQHSSKSVSLKRTLSKRKSQTKYNNKNREFNNIKSENPYQYTQFEEYISKLSYVKHNQQIQLDKYGKSNMKNINKIMEDFTDGISKYLHKRFNTEIIPENNFMKIWEIYSQFELITNKKVIRTFHIGESPGNFIKATQYYINRKCPKNEKFLWKANCFNPYNKEMKKKYGIKLFGDDYNLIKDNKSDWLWGGDDTGEITKAKHIRWYKIYLDAWLDGHELDVVTCNSSLKPDATLLEKQKLDFSHFLMTVTTTTPGKHCVNRTYTTFLGNSNDENDIKSSGFFVNLLFLYSLTFKDIYLVKPFTSSPTDGEFYIVGKHFIELPEKPYKTLLDILDNFQLNQTFFNIKNIPENFVKQVTKFIEDIVELNTQSIERQLFFLSCSHDDDGDISQKTNCKHYLETKNLNKLHQEKYYKWVQLFKFR